MKYRIDKNGSLKMYPKYYKEWAGCFRSQPDEIHEREGFYPLELPEHNPIIEELYDPEVMDGAIKYKVRERTNLPSIDEVKEMRLEELKEAIKPLRFIVAGYVSEKNLFGETIPQKVKDQLKNARNKYRDQRDKILRFDTLLDALSYDVPHAEINGFINQIIDLD